VCPNSSLKVFDLRPNFFTIGPVVFVPGIQTCATDSELPLYKGVYMFSIHSQHWHFKTLLGLCFKSVLVGHHWHFYLLTMQKVAFLTSGKSKNQVLCHVSLLDIPMTKIWRWSIN
jgi:hypothetical protein